MINLDMKVILNKENFMEKENYNLIMKHNLVEIL